MEDDEMCGNLGMDGGKRRWENEEGRGSERQGRDGLWVDGEC